MHTPSNSKIHLQVELSAFYCNISLIMTLVFCSKYAKLCSIIPCFFSFFNSLTCMSFDSDMSFWTICSSLCLRRTCRDKQVCRVLQNGHGLAGRWYFELTCISKYLLCLLWSDKTNNWLIHHSNKQKQNQRKTRSWTAPLQLSARNGMHPCLLKLR